MTEFAKPLGGSTANNPSNPNSSGADESYEGHTKHASSMGVPPLTREQFSELTSIERESLGKTEVELLSGALRTLSKKFVPL